MTNYWIIAPYEYDVSHPGKWEEVWAYDLTNNVISIGWGELGDISGLDKEELGTAVAQMYPQLKSQAQTQVTNMVWDFFNTIKPGDIVIARKGTKRIAAVGVVTEPAYFSREKKTWTGDFADRHYSFLNVHWLDAHRDKAFARPQFGRQTITRHSKVKLETLVGTALYLNGVFETVLTEILTAQEVQPDLEKCYLQPYSPFKINLLAGSPPSPENPVRLYISTTDNLEQITYQAEIIGWHDKQAIPADELDRLNEHIREYQPGETDIYQEREGKPCKNLLHIRLLERLPYPFPVSKLIKTSDGQAHKTRSLAGGWTAVFEAPEWLGHLPTRADVHGEFDEEVKKAQELTPEQRARRLANAPKIPEKVQVVSLAFRRNADVVAAVLERAQGICECCGGPAPFSRKSDGSPFLEVHHKKPLADDGEDTVENAMAVCPNCHRRLHFGVNTDCNKTSRRF